MVRAELRETRSPEETNWYFAIEVWACAWTMEEMHKTSAKLKLNFYLINLYVTLTWSKITLEEICKRNFKYSLIPEYDLSKVPFMLNFRDEIKKKKLSIHLSKSVNQKNLLGGESNPGLPRDRRGYSPLYYRGTGCIRLRINGYCNGETPHPTLK